MLGNSSEQRRTEEFVADTTDAIVRLLALAALPGVRSVRSRMLRWVRAMVELEPPAPR